MLTRRPVIVGSTGSIGSELIDQALASGSAPIGLARRGGPAQTAFDCLDGSLTKAVPGLGSADCVILAFGATRPDAVHADPDWARRLNVDATIRLLDEALDCGARAVFLSTELVFDGRTGGYDEDATPNPLTDYGRQKMAVETHLKNRGGDWVIVRTGASVARQVGRNCAVEKTYASLLKDGCVMGSGNLFSLTRIEDTARALLALCRRGDSGIYHFVAEPPVERVELARWIVADSRVADRMGFSIVPYTDIDFAEPRPLRSFMTGAWSRNHLDVTFVTPRDAVKAKVGLLDAIEEERNLRAAHA